jgi:hypothetical protein
MLFMGTKFIYFAISRFHHRTERLKINGREKARCFVLRKKDEKSIGALME